MKKPKGGFIIFIFFVAVVILMPISLWNSDKKVEVSEEDYKERGEIVHCTVTSVMGNRKHQYVEVIYRDSNDNLITAKATPNKSVSLSDEFEGYVLPETPNIVYCPADKSLKYITYFLFGLIYVLGWASMIMYINASRSYKLVKAKGVPVDGEIISVKETEINTLVKVRFTSASGKEHIKEFGITHGTPVVGDTCRVFYVEKKSGRCSAEINDFKIW